jgi:hypothetical protein
MKLNGGSKTIATVLVREAMQALGSVQACT